MIESPASRSSSPWIVGRIALTPRQRRTARRPIIAQPPPSKSQSVHEQSAFALIRPFRSARSSTNGRFRLSRGQGHLVDRVGGRGIAEIGLIGQDAAVHKADGRRTMNRIEIDDAIAITRRRFRRHPLCLGPEQIRQRRGHHILLVGPVGGLNQVGDRIDVWKQAAVVDGWRLGRVVIVIADAAHEEGLHRLALGI